MALLDLQGMEPTTGGGDNSSLSIACGDHEKSSLSVLCH